jgi:hypothetical protein
MRLLSGNSCSSEKSGAKENPGGPHFWKVLYEKILKVKNKPNPENFKPRSYKIKPSVGLLNLETIPLTIVLNYPKMSVLFLVLKHIQYTLLLIWRLNWLKLFVDSPAPSGRKGHKKWGASVVLSLFIVDIPNWHFPRPISVCHVFLASLCFSFWSLPPPPPPVPGKGLRDSCANVCCGYRKLGQKFNSPY